MADVLVFGELRDGGIRRPTLEAVGTARRLADAVGGKVVVLLLGPGGAAHAESLGRHGADRLLVAEQEDLALYVPETYAGALAATAQAVAARAVLAPGTAMGRDVIPRAAARLDAACMSDLVHLEVGEDGRLRGRRPVYSGKAVAHVREGAANLTCATLRPNVFPVEEDTGRSAAAVETLEPNPPAAEARARVVRVEAPETQEVDVAEASIIVSGGRGLRAPENFKLVRELAGALGGAVGASRAVVDAGWIAHAHQVGQTGKVVSPNLYIACGISGAIQHLAGMSSSKVIVAINKDPEAPIFKVADYGIVGDVFEILPRLTEQIRRLKAQG